MDHGHVKISRKAYADDPLWNERRKFSRWEAWEDMIQMAAWRDYVRVTTACTVELSRGEFVASLRYLATRWGWGFQKTRTYIEWMKNYERILTRRETQLGTVYVLVNYDTYQSTPCRDNTPKSTAVTHRQHTDNTKEKQLKQLSIQLPSKTASKNRVQSVVDHYFGEYPKRRVFSKADRKKVERFISEGFTAEDICKAITANKNETWARQTSNCNLDYLFRSAGRIQKALDQYEHQNEPEPGLETLT